MSKRTSSALSLLIGESPPMRRLRERIQRFAPTHLSLVLLGEPGTGKTLCARVVWKLNSEGPFEHLNCAALPEGLLESELFGHEKGAFTGATRNRTGAVARAHGGVLFLDEVAELEPRAQAKLLTTMESGEYRPLGSGRVRRSSFRMLAATNADLDERVASGTFRRDLNDRLGTIRLWIPPIRQRPEDIPLLARAVMDDVHAQAGNGAGPIRLTPKAVKFLQDQPWPGNVRQLQGVLQAANGMAPEQNFIDVEHLIEVLELAGPGGSVAPLGTGTASPAHTGDDSIRIASGHDSGELPTLAEIRAEVERRAVVQRLADVGGVKRLAAKSLGISEATLYRILRRKRESEGPEAFEV